MDVNNCDPVHSITIKTSYTVNNLNKQPIGQASMYIIEHIDIKPIVYAKDVELDRVNLDTQIKQILNGVKTPVKGLELEPLDSGVSFGR